MLAQLLKKEFVLSMHPVVPLFMLLSAMVLIPNYPYTVIFFYTTLGVFFTCMIGRENGDISYSVGLPITKKDVVRGRMAFVIIIELIQVLLVAGFSILRNAIESAPNQAGLEANLTLLGAGLVLFGIFNLVFFTQYYKAINKVGRSFVIATTVYWLVALVFEGSTFAIPYVRDVLDTPDPQHLLPKCVVLALGAVVFLLCNSLAYKKGCRSFEEQDLSI
ncbi:ABC-2 transporter permease [Eubacterium barkeri]|uniref:ABC-2 family transporter protein n=1 Tax=Eubacterium barkeri TaxID=1528 RepID=A0A1H3I1L6_EUBBA|nr:ABC-2 transporter permease [Eubacterium barkeri]SDY21600.1 ABC-2 family transporter protein [Eubacterium barkeri]